MPSPADLVHLSARQISKGLSRGDFKSTEVVEALIDRRTQVDGKLRSFVAQCEDAMQCAEEADVSRARGESKGKLHGVPMTIKDSVDLQGYDSTLGINNRVGRPATKDAVLVAELRRQGTVFLGKTNVPQALLAQETDNPIFGATNNPWDTKRTPGGSSGGEAAAIAAGLVPWGIGTDIGGSIRIPAHFCGIAGFKPTLDRWSNRGSGSTIPGQEFVRSQIGALARRTDDLRFLWEQLDITRMSERDPLVAPVPVGADASVDLRGMTIGVVEEDDFLPPCRSIGRAVGVAKEALLAAGATVVPHTTIGSRDVLATWLAGLTSDNARTMLAAIGSDSVSEQIKPSLKLMKIPRPLRRKLSGLLNTVGERRLGMLLDIVGEKSVTELWKLTNHRTQLRLAEFDAWSRSGLDALICPPHVVPALPHGASGDFILSLGAQFRWTLVGFPAGVVPVTRVAPGETRGYEGGNDRIAKKASSILVGSEGLPIGVQVVAKPFREEAVLAVMAAIESAVCDNEDFPSLRKLGL